MSSYDHTTSDNGLTRIEIKFERGQNLNNNKNQNLVKHILCKHLESYYREKAEKKKKTSYVRRCTKK